MNYGDLYERLNDFGLVKHKRGLVLPLLAEGAEEDTEFVKGFLRDVISKQFPSMKQVVIQYNGKTYHCVKGPGGGMKEINEGFFMKLVLATLLLPAGNAVQPVQSSRMYRGMNGR